MHKKTLALLLALLMLLCVGCSGKKQDDAAQSVAEKLKNAAAQQAAQEQTEETPAAEGKGQKGQAQPSAQPKQAPASPAPSDPPAPTSVEPAEPAAQGWMLDLDGSFGEPMEYGTEFHDDATFIDSYNYDIFLTVSFGRMDPEADIDSAVSVIQQLIGARAGTITTTPQGTMGDFPAYKLEYTIGSEEDTEFARDLVVLGEDAVHWFHCAVYADWFEEYEQQINGWFDDLALVPLVWPQTPGQRAG